MQIKNRYTDAVIFEDDKPTLRETVLIAVAQKANLADANLADADLADADLAGANLAGANLARADLARANLAGADLAGADLARANLAGADDVPVKVTSEPRKPYVKLSKDPVERLAQIRERNPGIPIVEDLDGKILAAIENGGGLEMSNWHTCETTHCMAGWAIHLAGDAGEALEAEHGPQRAGALIYRVSTGRAPHFFASNERALADLKERVRLQQPG